MTLTGANTFSGPFSVTDGVAAASLIGVAATSGPLGIGTVRLTIEVKYSGRRFAARSAFSSRMRLCASSTPVFAFVDCSPISSAVEQAATSASSARLQWRKSRRSFN